MGGRELTSGDVAWSGRHLVNPWAADGLVHLDDFPRMRDYLKAHAGRLHGRHVAKDRRRAWWRTIDRVRPHLREEPKLLVPDLKRRIHPVLDRGQYYPLHSLSFILAPTWDLEVLGGLLLSDVASSFIEAYSVRMNSGFLRVTAQYLRRVRIPRPEWIDPSTAESLRVAFRERDVESASKIAHILYGLDGVPF